MAYLGELDVSIEHTPYKDYTQSDWILYFIGRYGSIDGDHHKDWVLDQVARLANGTQPLIRLATWDNGHKEYRVRLAEPPTRYKTWVAELMDGEDGPNSYSYEIGIAP